MRTIVGLFDDELGARHAYQTLQAAGLAQRQLTLFAPGRQPRARAGAPVLISKGESILGTAVRWGIAGAVGVEVPSLVLIMVLPVDVNVKVLLGATVWKFGAAFGAWLGAMAGAEHGVEGELARAYEVQLRNGRWLVAAAASGRQARHTRGAMLESGALEARDVDGTLEMRVPKRQRQVATGR